MNALQLAALINRLLAAEERTLLRHLESARPYVTPATYRVAADLQGMARTSRDHARRLSALLERLDAPEQNSCFASVMASFHDVGVEAILPRLMDERRRQVAEYEQALSQWDVTDGDLKGAREVRCVLEALLAENRAQLERLEAHERALSAPALRNEGP